MTHILRVNCGKITADRPVQPAYEIFNIKRRFKLSKSRPYSFKVACARGHRRWVPPKKSLFHHYQLHETGYILWRETLFSLHNHCVECQLLGSSSLDFVYSGPLDMHHWCAFSFALAGLSCLIIFCALLRPILFRFWLFVRKCTTFSFFYFK